MIYLRRRRDIIEPSGLKVREELVVPPPATGVVGLLSLLPRDDHVPVVLYSVVCPAGKEPGDHGPFIAVHLVGSQEPLFLFLAEGLPVDPRVELVEPPKPATFPCNIYPQSRKR